MEKKRECEVVQDLLPSYIDKILHKESEKLIEDHIKQCEECSNILDNMQEKVEIKDIEQKRQIDYLKKIKRKGKIKIIFSILLVIFFIFLMLYLYNFILIASMRKTYRDTVNMDNYYYEVRSYMGEQGVSIQKIWKKGDKIKIENGSYHNEDETYHEDFTSYETIGSKEKIQIKERENIANKKQDFYETSKETALPYPTLISDVPKDNSDTRNLNFYRMIFNLGAPFYNPIVGIDRKEFGKPYYIMKTKDTETWIDRETLRPIKSIGYTSGVEYYSNSDVVKSKYTGIDYYILKPDTVTEEDVQIPDLSKYKVTKTVIEWDKEKGDLITIETEK